MALAPLLEYSNLELGFMYLYSIRLVKIKNLICLFVMQPSNIRIICNTVGSTIATTGLALITVTILFMISDTTTLAKQTIIHLPDLIANADVSSLGSDFTLIGFTIVLAVFMFGVTLRVSGLILSSSRFITRIENLWNSNKLETQYLYPSPIVPITPITPCIDSKYNLVGDESEGERE